MKIRNLLLHILALSIRILDGLAWRVREHALLRQFGRVGRNFVFDPITSKFVTPALLRTGDDCFLNAHAHVSGDIRLGDRVLIGPGVKLLSGNHMYGLSGFRPRFLKASRDNPELVEKQVIESDAWIGANAVVLGGVTLGEGCVLAAGAVATRDIPPYVVAAGVPARPVRKIFDDEQLLQHLKGLDVDEAAAAELVRRRSVGCPFDIPLARPPRPEAFFYDDHWVEPNSDTGPH